MCWLNLEFQPNVERPYAVPIVLIDCLQKIKNIYTNLNKTPNVYHFGRKEKLRNALRPVLGFRILVREHNRFAVDRLGHGNFPNL